MLYLQTADPCLTSRSPIDDDLGKLLRLRKDLATTQPCAEAWQKWNRHICPLLAPEEMLSQDLIRLPDSLISRLNKQLRDMEAVLLNGTWARRSKGPHAPHAPHRAAARHGVYLADDLHGLLITDMTPAGDDAVIEFKPKWLVQSPSAPRNAVRCRTCAINARRDYHTRHDRQCPSRPANFCPLRLTSKSDEDLNKAASAILDPDTKPPRRSSLSSNDGILKLTRILSPEAAPGSPRRDTKLLRFSAWARTSQLFHRLRNLQLQFDQHGVLSPRFDQSGDESDVEKLLVAMTLRDCSVYLIFPADESKPLVARVGDLDHKSPLKLDEWREKERQLISEGWYTGTERYGKMEERMWSDCMVAAER